MDFVVGMAVNVVDYSVLALVLFLVCLKLRLLT